MEDEHDTTNRTVDCMSPILELPRETGTKNKVCDGSTKTLFLFLAIQQVILHSITGYLFNNKLWTKPMCYTI